MQFRNSDKGYGVITVTIHWVFALTFISLFGIGLYMVELTYYDPLYKTLPDFHRGVGVLLAAVLVFRFVWKLINPKPKPEPNLKSHEIWGAEFVHWVLYLLPFVIVISGYLITTADGNGVGVFGLFEIPAILPAEKGREDFAGVIHYYAAFAAIGFVALHALAALKHHFVDHDKTLIKMLKSTDT